MFRNGKLLRAIRSVIEGLEGRVLLSYSGTAENVEFAAATDVVNVTPSIAEFGLPLSSVPQLSSRPGAFAKIYLDFAGEPAQNWNGYNVPDTPAFDLDGDPNSFNG